MQKIFQEKIILGPHTIHQIFFGKERFQETNKKINAQELLKHELKTLKKEIPANVKFLEQVHENNSIQLLNQKVAEGCENTTKKPEFYAKADAAFTLETNLAIAIRVADCIPLLFFGQNKKENKITIGGIHAGWKGLYKKIIPLTIQKICHSFQLKPKELFFFAGPSIGWENYETQKDVYSFFPKKYQIESKYKNKKFLDLQKIAIEQLQKAQISVKNIANFQCNVFQDPRFYSHRKGDANRNIAVTWRDEK